ncbi:hypothetical protein EJ419_05355 [Alloscardovia theropitheci]|uniref:Uncharacterized protein n=1 Tax=Alloscardovia theropitheci TaxID=2496842 RepID=A0A4R0QPE3_9BIFI|nr:hypothetical protein [Alloscardovia theropitheci]TCD54084.1 hypothetical protein EJ419_05355 [Alloscardovia theropitheci]
MNENMDSSSENTQVDAGENAGASGEFSLPDQQSEVREQAEGKEPDMKKSWSRSKVMRVIVMPVFAVLTVVALVMAILNLTVLRPAQVVSASANTNSNYVVVDAGVANLVADNVAVTATIRETAAQRSAAVTGDENSANRMMCVAVGSTTDVDAWMRGQAVEYTTIRGLSSWTGLATGTVERSGRAVRNAVDMSESDLWSQSNCAERTATLRVVGAQANQKIVIYSPSGVASVRMNWTRQNMPNTSLPWFAWMVVFAVMSALSFTWLAGEDPFGSKRRQAKREALRASQAALRGDNEPIPGVDAPYVPYQKKSKSGITHRTRQGGFFSNLFGKNQEDRSGTANENEEEKSKPIVVDPSSVNLVASTGADTTDNAWSPSVINRPIAAQDTQTNSDSNTGSGLSGEELLEYLARLAIEDRGNAENSSNSQIMNSNTLDSDNSDLSKFMPGNDENSAEEE